ncbi:MAG: metal-dependent transcriptional regulator [Salibacteraceae bacterium]
MASSAVENYLKAIFQLTTKDQDGATTNAISEKLGIKAATVSDMLKKLDASKLIDYKKYQAVKLTAKGRELAVNIVRKHRLWEVFLVDKLNFNWDEVHDLAEELEHIDSTDLVNRLEEFLGNPKFDPHGDPIPDREGNIHRQEQVPLTELKIGETGFVTGVKDSSTSFLQFLDTQQIQLGHAITLDAIFDYDQSRMVSIKNKPVSLSHQVCKNLFIKRQNDA